jgi:predicted nucleic acid-binding protein
MIILDTNVISALMLEKPEETIVAWLDRQPRTSIWTTAITVYEIRSGLFAMTPGRRRANLELLFDVMVDERLEQRVLPFDRSASEQAAVLHHARARRGEPRDLRDTMIAGIALAQRATLATGNLRHFDDLTTPVVDPWQDRQS